MDNSMRLSSASTLFAAVVVLSLALAGCGDRGEQKIYPIGTFTIARDDFLRPGTYKVEDIGNYACVISAQHGPDYGDSSDWVYIYEGKSPNDDADLTISDRDKTILVENDRCLLTRKGD